MNDFERRMRGLPWRDKSDGLKDKIFAPDPSVVPSPVVPSSVARPSVSPPFRGRDRRISVQLSLALASAAAFVGFIAGTMLPANQPSKAVASVGVDVGTDVRIVETSSPRNSFDFSSGAIQILPGEFVAYIDGEVENTR